MSGNKLYSRIIVLLVMVCCLFSCNKSVSDVDFISKLGIIDVSISAGQFSSAKKSLQKLEKSALNVYHRLGIIKRYFQLGEKEYAEDFILDSLKDLPSNVELTAVYTQFLLREGRLDEAEEYGKELISTAYASLYSEILFSKNIDKNQFYSDEYIDLYVEAAKATKNNIWLVNAAAIAAKNMDASNALIYKPDNFSAKDSPYFWAILEYDSENYVNAFQTLEYCENDINALQLKSDCLLRLNEIEMGNDFWISTIENQKEIPLEIYYNASKFSFNLDNYDNTHKLVNSLVQNFPYSERALSLYGNFCLQLQSFQNEKSSELLKDSTLRTISMEKTDKYPKIPVSDVLYRMENALKENYSSKLLIEYLKFKWIVNKTTDEDIIIDIWNVLEETTVENIYDEYILNFAISYFSAHHKEDVAESLFDEYIKQKYGLEDYGVYASSFDEWESETAAWYCVKNQKYNDALRLYENLCFEKKSVPKYHVLLNLGALYTALNKNDDALNIYKSVAGKALTEKIASEVHYRIGSIQFNQNDKKNALLSLNYSLKLNPDNHKARLLLKKLN